MLRVDLVEDVDGFGALKARWQPLLERAEPRHVFMTWEWLHTWWRHFGEDRKLFILTVEDDGELIGILPLMLTIRRYRRLVKTRCLHFIGFRFEQRWNDWIDIIAIRKTETVRAAVSYLCRCQQLWDYVDLWDIPESSSTVAAMREACQQEGLVVSVERQARPPRPYIDTTSEWEGYFRKCLSGKLRKDLGRQSRRLQELGELRFVFPDPDAMPGVLDVLFDLHQQRHRVTDRGPSMFAQKGYRDFYRALAKTVPGSWLYCPVLEVGNRIISADFGFRFNRRVYWITPAFDPEYGSYSPGKIALMRKVQDCFASDDLIEFDFLAGGEEYKSWWATGERFACRIQVQNRHMSGWVGQVLRRTSPAVRRAVITLASSSRDR